MPTPSLAARAEQRARGWRQPVGRAPLGPAHGKSVLCVAKIAERIRQAVGHREKGARDCYAWIFIEGSGTRLRVARALAERTSLLRTSVDFNGHDRC